MIKNIIFDFDGVICESVNIKTEAFYELYLPYGEDIANKVKEYHIKNGGMSRFEKFKYYEEEFLNKSITDEKLQTLSKNFSKLVKQKIIHAPFVKGAYEFLKNHSYKYNSFIVSATPQDEIIEISKSKSIDIFFKEILGSPKNKIELTQYLIDKYKMDPNETIFIGDAMSDYKAAIFHNLHFLLRNTKENKNLFSNTVCSINNLEKLEKILEEK